MRKPTHTAKFDRCVKDVKRSLSGVRDPHAVCQAALGQKALLHRSRNPLGAVRVLKYVVTAHKGASVLYLTQGGKLTRDLKRAKRDATVRMAAARAAVFLKKYPAARAYRLDVRLSY